MRKALRQPIAAGGEEFEEVHVAEDLELLADFVTDVAVARMKSGQVTFKGIYIGEREISAANGTDNV